MTFFNASLARYRSMGAGIQRRSRRLATHWAEHLQQTLAAQARWSERAHGDTLTVLGAGHLLDFNAASLLPRFARLRLVDANPDCRKSWKRLAKPYEAVCLDITCSVDHWIKQLNRLREPWPATMDALRQFAALRTRAFCPRSSAVLSLNILSQLQIVWQDGAEAFLQRRFGRTVTVQREAEWLDALRPAGQALVEEHLAAIEASASPYVLLICDLDYLEYRGREYTAKTFAAPPVAWSESEGWQADPGIICEISPALEGIELGTASLARWLPSYTLAWNHCWLWHIAPFGTEGTPLGKLNRVAAFALERSC